MKTRYINYLLILVTLVLWRCEPNVDKFVPTAGSADFSVYVSVGDSYSAGYTDGALSAFGQKNGFTNIMATQLQTIGADEFKQPMLPAGTSVGSSGNGSYVLKVVDGMLMPVPTEGDPELLMDPSTWINAQAPFNNVGVPGAKSFHLLSPLFGDSTLGAGNFNPFYSRFASNPGTSSVIGDAMLNNPSFFSLWVGGNDVLWYALAGGTGSESGIGSNDITPASIFKGSIEGLVATLISKGAKGVISNIPGIDALPYFSYIAYDNLKLTAAYATLLNQAYAPYNQAADANGLPRIEFAEGRNAFVVADSGHPLGMRQMVEGEKVLLSALSNILGGVYWGSMTPMPDQESLDLAEVDNISDAIDKFNVIIKNAAEANNLAFLDANRVMDELIHGIMIDGTGYNTTFVTGGMFSLDGIHASGRGSAIIANELINAINEEYGSTVPLANVNDYLGVEFP